MNCTSHLPERIEPTHGWQQLEVHLRPAGQRTCDLIRTVVLLGHSPDERAPEVAPVIQQAQAVPRPLSRLSG
jgi:hypothetical protein